MKKIVLLAVLLLALVFAAVACNQAPAGNDTTVADTTVEMPTEEATTQEAITEETTTEESTTAPDEPEVPAIPVRPTATGTDKVYVSYGESILEAVFREASEELGLLAFNPIYVTSYVFESPIERELVNVFAAVGSFDLKPDLDEVDEGRWWPISEIEENIGKSVFTPNFESEYSEIAKDLIALL